MESCLWSGGVHVQQAGEPSTAAQRPLAVAAAVEAGGCEACPRICRASASLLGGLELGSSHSLQDGVQIPARFGRLVER